MVSDAGGAVGVWTHLSATPLEYAHNVRALVDVIGVDHVCIGTDTKLTPASPRPNGLPPGGDRPPSGGPASSRTPGGPMPPRAGERTNLAWKGQTAGFYYVVVEAMLRTGFTREEISNIGGGNYLRIFGAAVRG